MEPYTLDRNYNKIDVIDGFNSIIWTERYYGDSEIVLEVPPTQEMIRKIPVGTFIGIEESDELMIIETVDIKNTLKASGISLLSWMNNRFVRTSALHQDRYWYVEGPSPGWVLWAMLYYMSVNGPWMDGTNPTGIPNPTHLKIPGLGLADYDKSGGILRVGIPFGPLYDAMLDLATTYEIGMKIIFSPDDVYPLRYRSYKGLNRTSTQTDNPGVRFSPQMDSFSDIQELQSIATLKTQVYSFAPGFNPEEGSPDLRTTPGISELTGLQYTGFDLRTKIIFADDITTDMVGGSSDVLLEILNNRAHAELTNNHFVESVDGEVVPDNQFKYGVHYNLGDIIEVQGYSGVIKEARITEYIRSQDSSGEKAYPTVTVNNQ